MNQLRRTNDMKTLILLTILKVLHLKFFQCSSWTSYCFHVELLWRIVVCNFLIHSSVLHKWYSFCTNLSHNNFLNFTRWRTSTYNNKLLDLAFLFFLIQNAHHVVRELPAIITLNFSLVWDNYSKTQKITFLMYFGHLNTRWTSLTRFFWTFPHRALELLATIFSFMSCF